MNTALNSTQTDTTDTKIVGTGRTAHNDIRGMTTVLASIFNVVRNELIVPLNEIAGLSSRLELMRSADQLPAAPGGEILLNELTNLSRKSSDFVQHLSRLGDFFLDAPLDDDERLLLYELITTSATEFAAIAHSRNVGLRIKGNEARLAPVYGSPYWLSASFEWLLGGLTAAAPSGTNVEISLIQEGKYQLVKGSILTRPPAKGSLDLLENTPRLPATAPEKNIWGQFDLAFVKASVNLHGGMLKTDISETGKLNQFIVTLPTGIPKYEGRQATCDDCQMRKETMKYANDLATLMANLATTNNITENSAS